MLAADGMDEQTPRAVLEGEGSYGARKAGLAVGETVILITPPCLSRLKHLIKVQGGCHQMTELSPTARPGRVRWGRPRVLPRSRRHQADRRP